MTPRPIAVLLVLCCACPSEGEPPRPTSAAPVASSAPAPTPSAPAPSAPAPSAPAARSPESDDAVLEAVLRHMLRDTPPSTKDGVCLRVRKSANDLGDPSDALAKAIRATWPTARNASECAGGGPEGPVRLQATGGPATMFDIGPVEWDGPDAARVKGAASSGGPHARELEFRLERAGGGWKVKDQKTTITT